MGAHLERTEPEAAMLMNYQLVDTCGGGYVCYVCYVCYICYICYDLVIKLVSRDVKNILNDGRSNHRKL
jgi:hypothetical protein